MATFREINESVERFVDRFGAYTPFRLQAVQLRAAAQKYTEYILSLSPRSRINDGPHDGDPWAEAYARSHSAPYLRRLSRGMCDNDIPFTESMMRQIEPIIQQWAHEGMAYEDMDDGKGHIRSFRGWCYEHSSDASGEKKNITWTLIFCYPGVEINRIPMNVIFTPCTDRSLHRLRRYDHLGAYESGPFEGLHVYHSFVRPVANGESFKVRIDSLDSGFVMTEVPFDTNGENVFELFYTEAL